MAKGNSMKPGIVVDNFFRDLPRREAFRKASGAGFRGVQFYVTRDLAPWELGGTARKDLRSFLDSLGLELPAVCADFGKGFASAKFVEWSRERVQQCIPLACDLGTNVLTTHVGKVPEDRSDPVYSMMQDVLGDLGKEAVSAGCVIAIETGPDEPAQLAGFLEDIDTPGLGINYDPSNLIRKGFDPVKGVYDLAGFIRHTHAKDGVRGDGEARLGDGDVSWKKYVSALGEVGFDGFLTVEREHMEASPDEEAAHAFRFVSSLL